MFSSIKYLSYRITLIILLRCTDINLPCKTQELKVFLLIVSVSLYCRASEYYADESLSHASESNLYHRTNASSGNYDSPSASQPEPLKAEINEQGNQYSYPSSAAGYAYESAQQLTAAFSQPQTSSQMQNLAPFSNVMVSYLNCQGSKWFLCFSFDVCLSSCIAEV